MTLACTQGEEPATTPRRVAVMIGQLGPGGSERQLYMFLSHCDRSVWDPVLYVAGALGDWEEPIRRIGVPITLLRGGRVQKMRQFRAACIADGATSFFSWSSYTNAFGLALLGLGMRRIGSFRNATFADLPTKLRGAWSWLSLAGVTTIVCNSRETCEEIALLSPRRQVVYAPNAVQTFSASQLGDWRQMWRAKLGVSDHDVLVLGVGRVGPQKNFKRFVDVIAQARKHAPIKGVIAGEDFGCAAELDKQIDELHVQDSVRLIGSVADARELMPAADIFLLTSDHEGMPNVVLEAMAAAMTCVTTNVNGIGDLIQDNVSGFVTSFSVEDLSQRVVELALDASLRRRLGANARTAIERFRPEKTIPLLWTLCDYPKGASSNRNVAVRLLGQPRGGPAP